MGRVDFTTDIMVYSYRGYIVPRCLAGRRARRYVSPFRASCGRTDVTSSSLRYITGSKDLGVHVVVIWSSIRSQLLATTSGLSHVVPSGLGRQSKGVLDSGPLDRFPASDNTEGRLDDTHSVKRNNFEQGPQIEKHPSTVRSVSVLLITPIQLMAKNT